MKTATKIRAFAATPAIAATFLVSFHATAQSTNAPVAEALYREGQQFLRDGKTHEACTKFEASQRLDPAPGTLINLALCHEKEGKSASAWTEYSEAEALAHRLGQAEREQFAHDHAATLERDLKRIVLVMAQTPDQVTIRLDGQSMGTEILGMPLPLDVGEHLIVVGAPGRKAWSQRISLGPDAVTQRIEVPVLEEDPLSAARNGAARPPYAVSQPATPMGSSPEVAPEGASGSGRRALGWVVGGIGVAGVGLAAFFGVRALLFNSKSQDEASKATDPTFSTQDRATFLNAAQSDHDSGSTNQTMAIVSGAAGAAALGVGTYLLLTSGSSSKGATARTYVAPMVGSGGGGVTLGRVW
jgi:hypothetical protein